MFLENDIQEMNDLENDYLLVIGDEGELTDEIDDIEIVLWLFDELDMVV
jgi:hypothetical protein